MGISHYWKIRKTIDKERFAKVAQDFKKVIPYLCVDLAGVDGEGEPEITEDVISFNGKAPYEYEGFVLSRLAQAPYYSQMYDGKWFSSCKVGFDCPRPYDIAVKIALIIAKHHLGSDIIVKSDEPEREWESALRFVERMFGYRDFKFGEEPNHEKEIIR